jgi:hypothetical protein
MQAAFDFAPAPPQPDVCRRRHRGNPESRAANERVHDSKAKLQERIYQHIANLPHGATCEEVTRALRLRYTTCSARMAELKALNRLFPSGERRPTSTGAKAAVLITDEQKLKKGALR